MGCFLPYNIEGVEYWVKAFLKLLLGVIEKMNRFDSFDFSKERIVVGFAIVSSKKKQTRRRH